MKQKNCFNLAVMSGQYRAQIYT